MKIDQEIKESLSYLESRDNTHPDYLPGELKDLQIKVFMIHSQMEEALNNRIAEGVADRMGLKETALRARAWIAIDDILAKLSFIEKLGIVEGFNDGIPSDKLSKVNKYRIEFAHPKGRALRNKYNYISPKSRENIRDLLRALKNACLAIDQYYSKFLKK